MLFVLLFAIFDLVFLLFFFFYASHNVHHYERFFDSIRVSIDNGTFHHFKEAFLSNVEVI